MKRPREASTKSGSDGKKPIRLGTAAGAAHPKSFIEIYAEHGVGRFESANALKIGCGFLAVERLTPIL